jgi:hypothetical protein
MKKEEGRRKKEEGKTANAELTMIALVAFFIVHSSFFIRGSKDTLPVFE